MISILIPNYNYNCQALVQRLWNEIEQHSLKVEIIIGDDASTNEELSKVYQNFATQNKVQIFKNEHNLGREKTRLQLANKAMYKWLLFLDADVLPKDSNFIQAFVQAIETTQSDVIFGGIAYQHQLANQDYLLRWKYGKAKEERSLSQRMQQPYRSLVTGAICIQKSVFIENTKLDDNRYGLDIALAYQLQQKNAHVLHIENPVYHLGLESNFAFLSKTKKGIESLVLLEKNGLISNDFRPIQKAYGLFKKMKLLVLCQLFFRYLNKPLEKNLCGKRPIMFFFDVYRMLYYCHIKLNTKNNA